MKAIVVDPALRSVQAVELADDTVATICGQIDADCYDTVIVAPGVLACVDDEGLLKELPFFIFDGYAHPLAGKALMLGVNGAGECVDCPLSISQANGSVSWCSGNVALSIVRASQAISAAKHRAAGFNVETDEAGLVNVITRGST